MAPPADEQNKLHFFDLPRELRDEIYKHYCDPSPRQGTPLERYTVLTSPAPLRVCKQFYAELLPIFYSSLEAALLQDRVCIKLSTASSNNRPWYAGWTIWGHFTDRCFSVWIRRAPEDDRMTGWWMDTQRVSMQEMANQPDAYRRSWQSFLQLSDTLEHLNKDKRINSEPVRSRLRGVQRRVSAVIQEVRKVEYQRQKAKLREARSHGNALRTEATGITTSQRPTLTWKGAEELLRAAS